jgi:hypothetical protein
MAPVDPERAAHCASCGAAIEPDAPVYTMRVDLCAGVRPLEFTDADLVADISNEWDALIAEMAAMTPREVGEETDKVHERYQFTLCAACRQRFHEQLKALQP